jgi:hypothetical protein
MPEQGAPDPRKKCPTPEKHTDHDAPTTYLGWHEWAERMIETHRPKMCPGCGMFRVWVPR